MHKILWHERPLWWLRKSWFSNPWIVVQLYIAPTDTCIDDLFLICSNIWNTSKDEISVWTHIAWEASDVRETSAIMFNKSIGIWELIEIRDIKLWPWDSIWVHSVQWTTTFTAYWEEIIWSKTIDDIKIKVLLWTATVGEKEQLALLTWWIYVIQSNVNNCNCP